MIAEERFKTAVRAIVRLDIFPGPAACNRALGRRPRRSLNGAECEWRRELMREFGIAYASGPQRGQLP